MPKECCDAAQERGKTGLALLLIGVIVLAFLAIDFLLALFGVAGAIVLFLLLYASGVFTVLLIIGVALAAVGITVKLIEHSECKM